MSPEPKAPSQAGGACLKHHLWEAKGYGRNGVAIYNNNHNGSGKSNNRSNNHSKGAGGMLSFKQGLSEAAAPGSSNPWLQVCASRSTASSYCPVPGFASCQYSAPRARLGASAPVLLPKGAGKWALNPFPLGWLRALAGENIWHPWPFSEINFHHFEDALNKPRAHK